MLLFLFEVLIVLFSKETSFDFLFIGVGMYFALISSDAFVFEDENVEVFDNFPID